MSNHNLQTSCYVAAAELTFTLTYLFKKNVIFQQSSQASSQEIPGFVFVFFNVFMSLQLFKNLRDNILYFIGVLSENTWKLLILAANVHESLSVQTVLWCEDATSGSVCRMFCSGLWSHGPRSDRLQHLLSELFKSLCPVKDGTV